MKMWKRAILGALALVIGMGLGGWTAYEQQHYFEDAANTTRQMLYYRDKQLAGSGSAVVIAEGRMVSAAHLFEPGLNPDGWRVATDHGKANVEIEFIDYDTDVAILKANVHCPCAELSRGQPGLYEEVFFAGYPLGIPHPVVTTGRYQGRDDIWHSLATAQIAPGNSGGGAFMVQHGRVVLYGITNYQKAFFEQLQFERLMVGVPHLAGTLDTEFIKKAIACADGSDADWCSMGMGD